MHCVQFVICESERVIFIFSNDALVMCVCVRVGMCVCAYGYVCVCVFLCDKCDKVLFFCFYREEGHVLEAWTDKNVRTLGTYLNSENMFVLK